MTNTPSEDCKEPQTYEQECCGLYGEYCYPCSSEEMIEQVNDKASHDQPYRNR